MFFLTLTQLHSWLVMVSIKAEIYNEIGKGLVMDWFMSALVN